MTAPFPSRALEDWRYADLDALKPIWAQLAEPERIALGPEQRLEQVWLPSSDPVQVRRASISLAAGASLRLFALNAAADYGRVELDVELSQGAEFELFAANIGTGTATNEIVSNVRHLEPGGPLRHRSRADVEAHAFQRVRVFRDGRRVTRHGDRGAGHHLTRPPAAPDRTAPSCTTG